MANHLIIGLGGTGGKIIREFRKRYFEEFHSLDPQNKVHVEYLYVDSSDADLNDTSRWKVMGTSVALSPSQKVSTHGINMSMLDNLEKYPNLRAMLTDKDVELMKSKLGNVINDGLGGQRRRLGRLLLANNLTSQNSFTKRLEEAVRRLTNASGENDVHFHVCAGLAGGTGSGSIVDVVAQIRKIFPPKGENEKYLLHLYLYVPENKVVSSEFKVYYQANGYAALMELNAMSVGAYSPLDMTGEKDLNTQKVQRIKPSGVEAFDGAFLFTNVNEKGRVLDLSHSLPAMVSDFLFHKTVTCEMGGEKAKMSRLEKQENEGGEPELNAFGGKERSRKFLSFGIHRIEFPETEIENYVTYNFANQASLQMVYNLWRDKGYDVASTDDLDPSLASLIKLPKTREGLRLSPTALMLAKPIEANEATKSWRDFESSWGHEYEHVMTKAFDYETDSWQSVFGKGMKDYFDKGFRTQGVTDFYRLQTNEISKYARNIRRHIEDQLMNDWTRGDDKGVTCGHTSILEIQEYVRLLIQDCIERLGRFDDAKSVYEKVIGELRTKKKAAIDSFDNARKNIFRKLFQNSKALFKIYGSAVKEEYVAKTNIEALAFARKLMEAVITELQSMEDDILKVKNGFIDLSKELASKSEGSCISNDDNDGKTTKKYDRDTVIETTAQSIRNEQLQKANAQSVRSAVTSLLGESSSKTFAALADIVKKERVVVTDAILTSCQQNVINMMNDAAAQGVQNKLRGVNILEKLREEYNTDEKLRQFAEDTVKSAVNFLQFDSNEDKRVASSKMIQLSIPVLENDKNGFRQKLIKAFEGACDFDFNSSTDVPENPKSNQLVIVVARAGFPLRCVNNVKTLKAAYDRLVSDPQSGELNRIVMHTETFSKALPTLYGLTPEEVKAIAGKVMLGFAMELFKEDTDKKTEAKFFYIPVRNEYDDIEKVKLGANFEEVLQFLLNNTEMAKKVGVEVEEALSKKYVANSDKQSLRQALNKLLGSSILESCDNDEYSDKYGFFRECRNELFDNKLKLQ